MIHKILSSHISSHSSLRRVLFILLIALMGVGSAWADTWDGTTKTAPDMSTNNGSSETLAIQITKAAELAWLGDQMRQGLTANGKARGNKYWKLTADIDLGGKEDFTGNDWAGAIGNTTNAFCGYFDGGGHTVSNIQVASITSAKYYGLFPSVQGESSSNLSKVKSLKIDGVYIKATTSMGAKTYIGGLTGYVKNGSISGVAASNVTITYDNGTTGANNDIGGLIGIVEGASGGQTTIKNNSVKNIKISIGGAVAEATYIGGAIGYLGAYTLVDGMSVNSGSITGPTTDKTVTNNKVFFVGGFLGYQHSSGTADYQPNKFKNIAVSGMTINLAHFVPGGYISNHKFAVGGIAGSVNAPNQDSKGNRGMPENLIAKGVKIYAPYAATSPTVANFNNTFATYSNYTGENITSNIDAIEKSKSGSWLYSDYQLGLSKSVLSGTNAYNDAAANGKVRRNYSASTTTDTKDSNLEWLTVDDKTFLRKNRYLDNERESWTVLWWTRTDNNASYANNDIEQTIYPQSSNTSTTGFTDYPYYMYFYQGVANAKYVKATEADAIISGIEANVTEAAKAEPLTLSIENEQEGQRGFAARTITVTPSSDDAVDSYKWYVDGVEQTETSNSIAVKPHWKLGKNIHVNAIKDSKVVASAAYALKVGVFKTKNNSGTDTEGMAMDDRGTSTNPYIIDSEESLRQLSYLSTLATATLWEGLSKPTTPYPTNQTQGHYNRAYYELGADITMGKDPFVPISHMGTNNSGSDGTYAQNWIFQGSFDGKGHKISGLNITWGAGQYNGGVNVYHGLFGAVGNTTASNKWQDASTGSTIIKNLIIDNATLTHDANNTSFYYNNGTSGNANNCMVGVLVGIVGSNTTIQNIEIRNSKITDADSYDYNLAKYGLYVGGAIGSVQNSSVSTTVKGLATNTKINHIAAQVDIALTHPVFFTATPAVGEVSQFNVGGIVGRYVATDQTQASVQGTLPKYTFYSGNINAPKAWISPVLAAVRYTSQNSITGWTTFSKQWEGNNNAAGTQLEITNAQYYKFKINGQLVSDLYPTNTCGNDARTVAAHTDATEAATTYDAKKYQGVNYAARYIDSNEATLYFMNQNPADNVYWVWDSGFPHMTDQKPTEAYIDRDGNSLTAEMTEGTGSSYRWQISFDGESWTDIDGATLQTFIANPSSMTKLIVAYVTSGGTEYRTQSEVVFAGSNPYNPYIQKPSDSGTGYTFNLVWEGDNEPSGTQTTIYQWYHSDQKTPFTGQTGTSLSLSQSELDAAGGYIWCAVTVKEMGTTVYKWMLVAGDLNVVYVNGNGYTGNNAGVGNDANNGKTPQTPVKTIDMANSLLDGGPWDKNIIVVMGMLDNDYDFRSTGKNPATLTGKWDGKDYEGVIRLKQIDPNSNENSVNPVNQSGQKGANCYVLGDTKFQYLTLEGDGNGNNFIECHGRDVWFGKGLKMKAFNNLSENHGNLSESTIKITEFTIILTATNLCEADIKSYTQNRVKPQVVTFESGHYGRIMGGRFTGGYFPNSDAHAILASAANPIWAIINIDIDNDNEVKGTEKLGKTKEENPVTYTCDINALIAGLTDGTMFGDYEINIHGGRINYVVGGNQGNPVINGTLNVTPVGGNPGKWGQWPNSSYFGRTIINVEQDPDLKPISIDNIYAGGLGRKAQDSNAQSVVDMFVYGHTEVNMKSGTVEGNIYGGGAGGVIGLNPWDIHIPYATTAGDNDNLAIRNGVQYGELGDKKAGSPLAEVTLREHDGAGGYTMSKLSLDDSSTTLNISGGTIKGNIYGGGCGMVGNMDPGVTAQGVGSVFGTSKVNVTGGTIGGSVYGGSQGDTKYFGAVNKYGQTITHIAEMNGKVELTIAGTDTQYPVINGSVYGAGQGIGSSETEEYLRIATAGNNDLGTEFDKNYSTDINITIDMPESIEFPNDIYGGGALGLVDGNTNIILKRGHLTGNIYGGGYGEMLHRDKARVTGTTNIYTGAVNAADVDTDVPITIDGSTIYGGGNMAQVTGNTYINLWHGNISADVYGGGRGLTETQSAGYSGYGWVIGNTRVLYNNTTTSNKLTGNVYGGGALGAVQGNTTVIFKAGEIEGNIFGGGQGEVGSEKAKVTGNTEVIVDSSWPAPTTEP